jgi:hypothetical protein
MQQRVDLLQAATNATRMLSPADLETCFDDPLIIVSVPRAGSTLLFEQLQRIAGFWSIGGESHAIFNAFPHLRAANAAMDSGCLDQSHADPRTCDQMRRCFAFLLGDHQGRRYLRLEPRPGNIVLLEKTPRNALNIPFLLEVFPRARFVFLHREPPQNIASIIEAWTAGLRTGRFVTFRELPGWDRDAWCFLLPPGWRDMVGKSLAEIAAFQWSTANRIMLAELEQLAADRWTSVSYEQLTLDPAATLGKLANFAGVAAPRHPIAADSLPLSRTTLTPPHADKWRRHAPEIENTRGVWQAVAARIAAL